MRYVCKTFSLAKDPSHPDEYEDAFDADPARGVAAIADGVSSSIFSGKWARILTRACLDECPPIESSAFFEWMALRRQSWETAIDPSQLTWHQKPKVGGGAFATLLWVEIDDCALAGGKSLRYRAFAMGDCLLMHVRQGALLGTFPLADSAEFLRDPMAVGSKDLGRDGQFRFLATKQHCQAGDLLILCTDALGAWAVSLIESGQAVDWISWWARDADDWRTLVVHERAAGRMRYDDTTVGILRIN